MHEPAGLVLDDVQTRLQTYDDARSSLPITNLMAFPLQGKGQPRGSVVVCRADHRPFTPIDVTMARAFTNQAALALELADSRADRSRLDLLEDRDRISRELQDNVLQRLFGAGLTIQGAAAMTPNTALREHLARAVSILDDTIRGIRSSIFGLPASQTMLTSVVSRALAIIAQLTPSLGFPPTLHLSGALTRTLPQDVAAELNAVLREHLGAIAQQASANAATVHISVDTEELCLLVTEDSGALIEAFCTAELLHLRRCAEQRGGHLTVDRSSVGVSLLRWAVPLPAE